MSTVVWRCKNSPSRRVLEVAVGVDGGERGSFVGLRWMILGRGNAITACAIELPFLVLSLCHVVLVQLVLPSQ